MEGFAVEVFATSWIEILVYCYVSLHKKVEVFATSWIEIRQSELIILPLCVEVFATSWIEMANNSQFDIVSLSRSLRPRGLKYQ